jgi:hypothetical protein
MGCCIGGDNNNKDNQNNIGGNDVVEEGDHTPSVSGEEELTVKVWYLEIVYWWI